jgi:N-acetyl-gamma-glutamyl-phosphate reductase
VSVSQSGESVVDAFPHLRGTCFDDMVFEPLTGIAQSHFREGKKLGLFTATPHGKTAQILGDLLEGAQAAKAQLKAVDLSADFRFPSEAEYTTVYGHPHGAPAWLEAFTCCIPEHFSGKPDAHAVQPGCFTTATTLAAYPFVALDLVEEDIFVSAVTGSSGSGRSPSVGTHHPERRSNLHAYAPLSHRHEAEMRMLLSRARPGGAVQVDFVPHSGPFVRGIHATLRMTLRSVQSAQYCLDRVSEFYADSPFVQASLSSPRLTEVIGTNRCRLGITTRGRTLVVTSVIDNLVKGAAGGAIQWMNRLFDLPQDTGLRLAGLGYL